MKYLVSALAASFVLGFVTFASAADDANGTWKWTFTRGDGDKKVTRDVTLKLKQDGEKLTGTISGRENTENPISEGSIKGGEVSFQVVREANGNKFTTTYKGKLSGDTIKGTTESPGRDNKTNTREWEAKRAK